MTTFFPDNTTLINFAYVHRIQMLGALLPDRAWTGTIHQECVASSNFSQLTDLQHARAVFGPPLHPTAAELQQTQIHRTSLSKPGDLPTQHLGEAETLAIIQIRLISAVFITDDKEARNLAIALGIKVASTWQLLKIAKNTGQMTVDEAVADCRTLKGLGRGGPPGMAANDAAIRHWLTT